METLVNQDNFYDTTMQLIGNLAKIPIVRVNRSTFLSNKFSKSPHLAQILEEGPLSVHTADEIKKMAMDVVNESTNKTSVVSFLSGLPSNPVTMVAAGGADVVQYFGFALNMAQQISYLFGDAELFDDNINTLSEDEKARIVALLAGMLGVAGASKLIMETSISAGKVIGKRIASKALTKTTTWYPLLKKVAAMLGKSITKKTVQNTITKAVPIIGGAMSGALTYFTFRPMGNQLVSIYYKKVTGTLEETIQKETENNEENPAQLIDGSIS
ncbi:MAG: hypothetical protein QM308_05045 [Bacillota bacterium]|nr:hypothetical protein [Bacillota bacterium]